MVPQAEEKKPMEPIGQPNISVIDPVSIPQFGEFNAWRKS